MAEKDEGIAKLKEAIPRIVTEQFESDRRVVFLAKVGQRLRREGLDFKEVLGDVGLAKFIRDELAGEVELTHDPHDPKVVSAYPSSVDLSQEVDPRPRLGTRATLPSQRPPSTSRLFIRDIWYAFSHPLEAGKTRYVRLTPAPAYRDIPDGEEVEDGFKVSPEDIIPTGTAPAYDRNRMIIRNIEKWAAENGIPLDEISERPRKKAVGTALDVLLNSIPPADLSRVSMPLDVIRILRLKTVD